MLVLPEALREVSAICAADAHTLACVQDEAGALFFVDLRGQSPPRSVRFGPSGDYEGLARVGDDYWVLRSDGVLLHVAARGQALHVAATHRLELGHQNYEGLCHDPELGALLVLPKDPAGAGKRERDRRCVYAFDLLTRRARAEPAVAFTVKELVDQASARGIELPSRTDRKGAERVDLKLRGSEILCVPGSADLLLLSAVDRAVLRIDRGGKLVAGRLLDADVLPQPEGMAFLPDGRFLVASEGDPGRICVVELR